MVSSSREVLLFDEINFSGPIESVGYAGDCIMMDWAQILARDCKRNSADDRWTFVIIIRKNHLIVLPVPHTKRHHTNSLEFAFDAARQLIPIFQSDLFLFLLVISCSAILVSIDLTIGKTNGLTYHICYHSTPPPQNNNLGSIKIIQQITITKTTKMHM
jgi:hypothetical protein